MLPIELSSSLCDSLLAYIHSIGLTPCRRCDISSRIMKTNDVSYEDKAPTATTPLKSLTDFLCSDLLPRTVNPEKGFIPGALVKTRKRCYYYVKSNDNMKIYDMIIYAGEDSNISREAIEIPKDSMMIYLGPSLCRVTTSGSDNGIYQRSLTVLRLNFYEPQKEVNLRAEWALNSYFRDVSPVDGQVRKLWETVLSVVVPAMTVEVEEEEESGES